MLSSDHYSKIFTRLSFLFAAVIVVKGAKREVPVCGGRISSTVAEGLGVRKGESPLQTKTLLNTFGVKSIARPARAATNKAAVKKSTTTFEKIKSHIVIEQVCQLKA